MELAVLNTQGNETGRKVVLSDAVFGVEANDHAIYLDVKQYLADQRQGTHKGVTSNGFSSSGFYVGFLLLIILVVVAI